MTGPRIIHRYGEIEITEMTVISAALLEAGVAGMSAEDLYSISCMNDCETVEDFRAAVWARLSLARLWGVSP